jgi:hypothetical protein
MQGEAHHLRIPRTYKYTKVLIQITSVLFSLQQPFHSLTELCPLLYH